MAFLCAKTTARCGFALGLLLIALPAFGWGAQGHRLVARLAEAELTPAARAEAARLLAGESDPSLAGVANWADEIRDRDALLFKRTWRWHFVNLAGHACRYRAIRDCPGGDCVVAQIARQAAVLRDRRQPVAVRRDALKFLVHFVGDVHQPLHAGHARDRGGNDTQVNDAGFGTNLHALWDSRLLQRQRLSDDAYTQRLQSLSLVVDVVRAPLPAVAAAWAESSCGVVVQAGFYPPKPALQADYFARWTPIAELQMRRAGSHLAQLLNAALGDG